MQGPLISVLMCVHNGGTFVREAIESILTQTYSDFEFVIVEDGSTDNTFALLQSFSDSRIRIFKNETNIGLTRSLNIGLHHARGEFIARQDADDISLPCRLEKQVLFMTDNADVVLCGTQAFLIRRNGTSIGKKEVPLSWESIRWENLFDNSFLHSSVMFSKSVAAVMGGYDESFAFSQDYELFSRISLRYPVCNLVEYLVTLRIVDDSITRKNKSNQAPVDLIRANNIKATLPLCNLSLEDISIMGQYRAAVTRSALARFRRIYATLLTEYFRLFPALLDSGDFERTLSMQRFRIGYNLFRQSRLEAIKEIVASIILRPSSFFHRPWHKVMARLLFGSALQIL